MRPLQLDFTCTLARAPQLLSIEYKLTNREPVTIGLFNQIIDYEIDGTWIVSPDTAYIELTGSVLSIAKRALDLPDDLSGYSNAPPYVTAIKPGKTFQERVRVPLPARVMHPFLPLLLDGQAVADRRTQASSLRFSVAAFPVQGDDRLRAREPAWPRLLEADLNRRATDVQRVLSREFALGTPVEVLDYRAVLKDHHPARGQP